MVHIFSAGYEPHWYLIFFWISVYLCPLGHLFIIDICLSLHPLSTSVHGLQSHPCHPTKAWWLQLVWVEKGGRNHSAFGRTGQNYWCCWYPNWVKGHWVEFKRLQAVCVPFLPHWAKLLCPYHWNQIQPRSLEESPYSVSVHAFWGSLCWTHWYSPSNIIAPPCLASTHLGSQLDTSTSIVTSINQTLVVNMLAQLITTHPKFLSLSLTEYKLKKFIEISLLDGKPLTMNNNHQLQNSVTWYCLGGEE